MPLVRIADFSLKGIAAANNGRGGGRRPFQCVNMLYFQLLTELHGLPRYGEMRVRRANHGRGNAGDFDCPHDLGIWLVRSSLPCLSGVTMGNRTGRYHRRLGDTLKPPTKSPQRRKLSIRPCVTSSSRMLGILDSRFILRSFGQKPSRTTTARTGTVFSLAKGEQINPASFQFALGAAAGFASSTESESNPRLFDCAPAIVGGTIEAAAEAMELRPVNRLFMGKLLSGIRRLTSNLKLDYASTSLRFKANPATAQLGAVFLSIGIAFGRSAAFERHPV